ncbi:MAG: undecaprenyl/decaprenyl-phosphate alpha-N-acetylglucosaminyl 1-phosphate transferase [Planctomycetota bacterium]|nr:MAG: undecaprenyl/decaprenyl-phosphate alpha-N-acetylglucosaminyl 1-phosphate transferase [Planctomycetota bacterium]
MRRLAPRIGLLDQPAERKVHRRPTPLGGGLGIWAGVVLPLAAAQLAAWWLMRHPQHGKWLPAELLAHVPGAVYRAGQMWALIAGGTILTVMGLLDDYRNLPWPPRLLLQTFVATGLVAAGFRATLFVPVPVLTSVVTVLWFLTLINALNFLDNMDGLTAGIGSIASAVFATIMLTCLDEPRWLVGGTLLLLTGATAGFLWHNWPPARIFMGDCGSHFVGLMLAAMTVQGTFYESTPATDTGRHVVLAPLCVLAVPLYDFCSVIWIRLREGRSPFHPDKSHFSHRLVELGLSPRNAVMTIHLATLTTGLAGILLYRVPDWTSALLIGALVLCVLAIVAILETAPRLARRSDDEVPPQSATPCSGEHDQPPASP